MRVMNLMIVLAVIATIILAAQYFSQLRKNRNGNNFVSGGRIFFNWTLVAVLVICVGGIIFGSIHSHRQEAKPAQTDKTENVEYAASDSDNLGKVSIQFDRKVTLNDNGEAKVKFKVSPQTTLTIRGHKSKEIVKTFKASKGESLVNHTYTFDVAGTYDIIAERGDQKITKQLKVKGNDNAQESSSSSSSVSSSSSSVASSASSTVPSSSSSTASTAQNNSESSSSTTAASSNNGGTSRSYNTSRPRYSGNGGGNRTSSNPTPTAPARESSAPAYSQEDNGYVSDGPQY
ncbi:cellulose 1,4-beta-cellobiosidase [Limosilactobacillus reuteri]|uniref:Cellulose 1,4-beta-cellobiosidase n=1 Tax=Limosilactobacillus reuteri TaxID=1598 RepID=A0A0U5JV54_LIMRT|nr:cellulose 1,4-beta-cellobiosidase [Limosilactobacillus reuteri]